MILNAFEADSPDLLVNLSFVKFITINSFLAFNTHAQSQMKPRPWITMNLPK